MSDDPEIAEAEADEKIIGTPVEDVKDLMRQARQLIPVGPTGATPKDMAQQVDFARDMARAKYSIPDHLKANVGDCLAVVDMASRAGLSPYMVAAKTYVQNGKLNFESQLYHAFLQASGLLKGDLDVEYVGEGEDLICKITGYLRGDPTPKIHRSEPLKNLHPGHVEKDGRKWVRGSPLWDKKPKLQMFYDASRDWVRMYAPRATLGILTPYEVEEYGPEFARDVTPGLSQRLKGGLKDATDKPDPETELDQIANGGQEAGPEPAKEATEVKAKVKAKPKAEKPAKDVPKGKAKDRQKDTAPAEKTPTTVKEYLAYAKRWIEESDDMTSMGLRWRDERSLRNKLGLTAEGREPLEKLLAKRYGGK